MALLATATHVVLMATSVVADILMLYDDDGVNVVSNPEHAVRTSVTFPYTPLIDRRTHHHPVSAPVNKQRSPERPCGTGRMLRSRVAVGGHDFAAAGSP